MFLSCLCRELAKGERLEGLAVWPGWVSSRNKKVRRTNSRPAHAETSPERLSSLQTTRGAREIRPPSSLQLPQPPRAPRPQPPSVTFASTHPFQPPACPGSRGPHDPSQAAGRPPSAPTPSSRPGLPAEPQAAAIATCPGAAPPAVGCSGSGRPFKWKPLSPSLGMPYSACGRTAPPCPAPHRNESGRADRSAPPRGAVCTLPPRSFALQQLPRRMV